MRLHFSRQVKAFLPSSPLFRQQLRTLSDWERLVMASTAAAEVERQSSGRTFKNKGPSKRTFDGGHGHGGGGGRGWNNNHNSRNNNKRMKKVKVKPVSEGSSEEVLTHDIRALLEAQKLEDEKPTPEGADGTEKGAEETLPEPGTEIEVEVLKLSSTGDGLARQPGSKQIYVVPFSIPGDTVKIKVYRHVPKENHSVADFISVVKPSPLRDDSRVNCQYFTKCSGCQLQMMAYEDQLAHKRSIVERAFQNFSQLPPELVPTIQDTMGSPLQYGYRTKLTPHFDAPFGTVFRRGKPKEEKKFEAVPDIGFNEKGKRSTLDIEDCPIGTEAVRKGMARERARMQAEFGKYSRGATILLRESTRRVPKTYTSEFEAKAEKETSRAPSPPHKDAVVVETDTYTDIKTCITDNNAQSTEYVDDFVFTSPAGSFFQNNNSILPTFTNYIHQHILPPTPPPTDPSTSTTTAAAAALAQKPIKYLIDAYSGSGLFTITQSALFQGGSIGIDIDEKSINWARRNAVLNHLPEAQCKFIAADAPKLFQSVSAFDPDETVVVLDPPRKGCDGSFLRQLLRFAPRRVVYVSCNVHTQARDVGILVRGEVEGMGDQWEAEKVEWEGEEKKSKVRYEIESIRGFDFFPQTGHVEGVAVLNRVVEA